MYVYIRNNIYKWNFNWKLDFKQLKIYIIFLFSDSIFKPNNAAKFWLLDSFDNRNNIDDFLLFHYLYSIYLYCTYLCVTFRHRRRALHGTRVSHGRSNICSSVIAPLFLPLPITLILGDERVFLLSVNRSRIQIYIHARVRTCRVWNHLSRLPWLPSAGSTVYAQRDLVFVRVGK